MGLRDASASKKHPVFSPRPNLLVLFMQLSVLVSRGSPMSNRTQHTSMFFHQTMKNATLIHLIDWCTESKIVHPLKMGK